MIQQKKKMEVLSIMEKVVRTKEELKKAMDKKVDVIIVEGELAESIAKLHKVTKLGPIAIGAFCTALLAIPVTGGISAAAAAPAAALVGISPAVLITAIGVFGVAIIVALLKGYDMERRSDGSVKLTSKK